MKRPKIYIAGPFRAPTPWIVRKNIDEAEAAGLMIAKLGGIPFIPHSMYAHFDKSLPDEFWLDASMALLRSSDAIFMLPKWRASEGATNEHDDVVSRNGVVLLDYDEARSFILSFSLETLEVVR